MSALAQGRLESCADADTLTGWLARAGTASSEVEVLVYFVDGVENEVRLVEVSGSLGNGGPGEVLPFRFNAQPEQGVPFPSVVVLLSPAEWGAVERGELDLPAGWERTRLKKVG